MTDNHRERIIPLLVATQARYPRLALSNATLNAYADELRDIELEDLDAILARMSRTHSFFPSIAEIREKAAELALDLPTVIAAWQQALAQGDRHWLVDQARNAIGDSWYWRTTDVAHLQRTFEKAYTQLRAEVVEDFQARGTTPLRTTATA